MMTRHVAKRETVVLLLLFVMVFPIGAQPVSLAPNTMSRMGTVEERFQSYNVEMVEVTGGRFWKRYDRGQSAANTQTPTRQPGSTPRGSTRASSSIAPPSICPVSTLKTQADSDVYFPHFSDGRRFSEERRRQRTAIPEIVDRVGEILTLHEHLKAIPRGSLIERANRGCVAAAEHADAGWERSHSAERKLIRHEHVHGRLPARMQ
jgi:hypothetical protein